MLDKKWSFDQLDKVKCKSKCKSLSLGESNSGKKLNLIIGTYNILIYYVKEN